MARTLKNPEERRKELIDIAERLFSEKGYEQTAVSDIVREAEVAQGTFYYYFKSKEEILDAIVEDLVEEMIALVEKIVSEEGLSAVKKMLTIFSHGQQLKKERLGLIDLIHQEKNELLHARLEKRNLSLMAGYYEKIIAQGVKEGVFDTPYPREAALAIFAVSSVVGHNAAYQGTQIDLAEIRRLITINLDITERILGAKPGTFKEVLTLMEMEQ